MIIYPINLKVQDSSGLGIYTRNLRKKKEYCDLAQYIDNTHIHIVVFMSC